MPLIYPRISGFLGLAKTKSFRLGSSMIDYFGEEPFGMNMQNPDKKHMRYCIADEGKTLVQIDQAGAEALIVAYECRDGNFRALFKNKIKPHVFVSLHVFADQWKVYCHKNPHCGLKPCDVDEFLETPINDLQRKPLWNTMKKLIASSDSWPAKERYYFMGKCGCHASNYKIGPGELQLNILLRSEGAVYVSKKFAEEFLHLYTQKLFLEISEWQSEIYTRVKETKLLRNLFGYPRRCYQFMDESYWKDCLSWIPQSTVACITHIAYKKMQDYIEENHLHWDLLNNKHDSFLIQCPDDDIEQCKTKCTEFMNMPLVSTKGEHFQMKSGLQVGKNWAPWSEQNTEGMKEV